MEIRDAMKEAGYTREQMAEELYFVGLLGGGADRLKVLILVEVPELTDSTAYHDHGDVGLHP